MNGRGPLPIVIGVVGHRDLRPEDVPALEEQVRLELRRLKGAYPNTPLLVLTSLAIGADRLAARVATSEDISLVVPLPLKPEEFERDFPDSNLLAEFRSLRDRALHSFFVGYVPGNDDSNVIEPARRDMQYAQVGSYISRNSHLLIALWNGLPSTNVGGTAQVVAFKLEGRAAGFAPPPRPLDLPENGPVCQIVTPRLSDPRTNPQTPLVRVRRFPERTIEPPESKGDPFDDDDLTKAVYTAVDRFNKDALSLGMSEAELTPVCIRSAAERLAKRYQKWKLRTLTALHCIGLVAAGFFLWYRDFAISGGILIAYVAFSALAMAVYWLGRAVQLDNRYQDYRALAEGLRIQDRWQQANIRETVADHYMRQHRGELDWIRNAIRVCRLLDDSVAFIDPRTALPAAKARLEQSSREWIDEQIGYFRKRAVDEEGNDRMFRRISRIALGVSFLCVVMLGVFHGLAGKMNHELFLKEGVLWKGTIFAAAMTAVVSGLSANYSEQRAFAQHAKQFRRMHEVFTAAALMLQGIFRREPFEIEDYTACQAVIKDLGEEALAENSTWLMYHRDRPLQFVSGA